MDDNLEQAWELLHDRTRHAFITGNAGTGKTTLIKKFVEANQGRVIVLAPTGIAAVNAGGMTIHRFFHFPARPISYSAVKWLNPDDPIDNAKRILISKAYYLVIDEISMVRADLMDQIGWFFHKNFGKINLKIIMVGDLDQLPPVVSTEEEKEMIYTRYKSEFFFHATMWTEFADFTTIKLTKVFRQTDPVFVDLLNRIKNNECTTEDITSLNERCLRHGKINPEDGIMLCSTNAIASEVNDYMINKLPGESIKLVGEVSGNFNHKNCTCDPVIELKELCRVMTMRNDQNGEYANGSIGTLISYNRAEGYLLIKLDSGAQIRVTRYTFETIEYKYDKATDKIIYTPAGKFIQFPVRVAYALTVHKSQGKTFDKVIIDLGDKGAFAHGQTYVALSRCTSIEGITLRRPIAMKDLIYNHNVLNFNNATA